MHHLLVLIIYLGGIIIIVIFQKLKEVNKLVQLLTSRGDSKPALFPSKACAQFTVLLDLLTLTWQGPFPAGAMVACVSLIPT